MTIEIGWWVIPSMVTALAFAWAAREPDSSRSSGYIDLSGMVYVAAFVMSLIAWFIWLAVLAVCHRCEGGA